MGKSVEDSIQVHSDGVDLISHGVCEEGGGVQDWPDRPALLCTEGVRDDSEEVVFE